jgi:drug/metabolite transporter (DMT)-like permease
MAISGTQQHQDTTTSGGSRFSAATVAQVAALGLIWGFTFLFIKVSVEGLSPLWLVSVRTLSGFVVLLVALRLRRIELPRDRVMWLHIAFLAVPANVIPWGMVAWAQHGVTSAMTAVLYSLIPLMTLVIAAAISLEQFNGRKLIGLILASAGTAVAVGFDSGAPGSTSAVAAVLAACALLAAGAVYAKRHVTPRVPALTMATIQLGIAFLVSTPLALAADGPPEWDRLTPSVLGASLTLGVVGTGLAFLLYYLLIERVGATNATMITYITPVIGIIAGGVILDEPIEATLLAGGAGIILGIWIAQGGRRAAAGAVPV